MDNMKKQVIGVIVFLSIVLFAVLASAAITGEEEKVNQGYLCLENKVNESTCNLLTLEQKLFSFLAIGKCLNETLNDASANLTCWPSSGCQIKPTAQAVFTLTNAEGVDLTNAINWLKSKNATATDLVWLLQVESSESINCTLTIDSIPTNIKIGKNKVVTSVSSSSCFAAWGQAQGYGNNYWIKVLPACYNKKIEIKCDQSALTALLYKKDESFSTPIYVSNDPQTCEAGQTCIEEINSYCFSTSGDCTNAYEPSLWAALAFEVNQEDLTPYLPYLITMADDPENEKYLPYSFLYIITNSIEYSNKLLDLQISEGSWGDVFNGKYYGTALAMLPYMSNEIDAKTQAKTWLLNSQDSAGSNKGCWNSGSIRDTAFILYSLWGNFEFHGTEDECTTDADCEPGEVCVNGKCILDTDECTDSTECSYGEICTGGVCIENTDDDCEDNGGYCIFQSSCDDALGAKINFACDVPDICCNKPELVQTCSELGGTVCGSGQSCVGTEMPQAAEGGCCSGTCNAPEDTAAYDCKLNGGRCSITGECNSDESPTNTYKCKPSVDQCCMPKTGDSEGKSYWWIWVLVILIIIVAVAIIFRDKLKEMWLRMKMKKGGPAGRPGLPPRPMPPSRPSGPPRGEVNDVLRKLKEMGK